ncbi:NEQ186 [Nanoarchaeum equitans Kin4-M]|uniref:NEQ186 n=1 Tax=Nanoarchaeum equitans (strain Kin4-M) TaxID=228908 RepID=Q74ND1_NANEQ|nr:NEQ186 [Nanoarchaeum equitans Kin4-M]
MDEKEIEEILEENKRLKSMVNYLQKELEKFRSPPLVVAEVIKPYGERAIVRLPTGMELLVEKLSKIEIEPGDTVFLNQSNMVIVGKAEKRKKFNIDAFVITEKPNVDWSQIGGLKEQIEEIREAIELPLTKPEIFEKIGIEPPKGVLLYGPPGTGKTLIGKALAKSANATFIYIVGSELVQKYIGEGAKLVKELFDYAREHAPAIVFIDEIDAIAARRIETGTSGEREVQRTFMQLLAEIDGFKPLDKVKVIGATNRLDILDPAILRPGRFDRIIHIPLPDKQGRIEIFKIHTRKMRTKDIDYSLLAELTEGFSGAEIKQVCIEAGYLAIRNKRDYVILEDFIKAIDKVKKMRKKEEYQRFLKGLSYFG